MAPIIKLDAAKIEALLLAGVAKQEDVHRKTAAEIFSVPEQDVTPVQRRVAKSINYFVAYAPVSIPNEN